MTTDGREQSGWRLLGHCLCPPIVSLRAFAKDYANRPILINWIVILNYIFKCHFIIGLPPPRVGESSGAGWTGDWDRRGHALRWWPLAWKRCMAEDNKKHRRSAPFTAAAASPSSSSCRWRMTGRRAREGGEADTGDGDRLDRRRRGIVAAVDDNDVRRDFLIYLTCSPSVRVSAERAPAKSVRAENPDTPNQCNNEKSQFTVAESGGQGSSSRRHCSTL